jgi:RNA polymerase sigma-70 factor (ECF subfamily)
MATYGPVLQPSRAGGDRAFAEDAALAARVAAGDRSAEERVVTLFHDRVRLMALARTRRPDVAADVAQDVMIAAVLALRANQLREGEKLAGFIHGIARNLINNHLRSAGRAAHQPIEDADVPRVFPPDEVERRERTALVRAAIDALPPTDRQILVLTLVAGLKPGEIARRLSLSDEVVRARKSRATKKVIEHVDRVTNAAAEPL